MYDIVSNSQYCDLYKKQNEMIDTHIVVYQVDDGLLCEIEQAIFHDGSNVSVNNVELTEDMLVEIVKDVLGEKLQ